MAEVTTYSATYTAKQCEKGYFKGLFFIVSLFLRLFVRTPLACERLEGLRIQIPKSVPGVS